MIYVIRASFGPIKVGRAKSPESRLRQLTDCQAYTAEIAYTHTVPARLESWIERRAHEILHSYRIRGEWFDVSIEDAERAIQQAVVESQMPALVSPSTQEVIDEELASPQYHPSPAYPL